MVTIELRIENMHCGACVRRVTVALGKVPATTVEEVRIGAARVRTEASAGQLAEALGKAGYPASAA